MHIFHTSLSHPILSTKSTWLLIESVPNTVDKIAKSIFSYIRFVDHFVEEVLPIEWGPKERAARNVQDLLNIFDDFQSRCGSQTQDGHFRKLSLEDR